MKNRGLAIFLLAILLVSICATAFADDGGGYNPIRYRNGKAFTLYVAPSLDAPVIGTLPARTVFSIAFFTSIEGATWACIMLDNGSCGYITSGGGMVKNLRMLAN